MRHKWERQACFGLPFPAEQERRHLTSAEVHTTFNFEITPSPLCAFRLVPLSISISLQVWYSLSMQQAARGQRPPLVGEEVRKEDIGKVES
jgi:hypothetical protein